MKFLPRIIPQFLETLKKAKSFSGRKLKTTTQLSIASIFLLATVLSSTISLAVVSHNTNSPLKNSQQELLISQASAADAVMSIEQKWETEYENYFGANLAESSKTTDQISITLLRIALQTGKKPAVIWAIPQPEQLKLMLITPGSKPKAWNVPEANREVLLEVARKLRRAVASPRKTYTKTYLIPARQLYQWIVAPLEATLEAQNIDTLLFCTGTGLRSLPLSVLHDGQRFLVEKYGISRIPAFNLIETDYARLRDARVLAMGASEFSDLNPLPAVPVELSTIADDLWQGQKFLNQGFTLENLKAQLTSGSFNIVHLATHAEFNSGEPDNSYIQFWDSKLRLDRARDVNWNDPPIELLVLSACKTALGNQDAELGFAGLALQAGVKSALASLWYVSDAGTLALMTEFYQQLKRVPIKVEALRQAQIAMIQGRVRLEGGELRGSSRGVSLPPELAQLEKENLSHPYYWAAFMMISSPW